MAYDKYFLSNGLKVILKHKASKSIHAQINFRVGSINELKGEKGYSHLLEHMLFEGTKKRPNAQIICSEIENLGGEVNAATSNESTYYYIRIPSIHYEKSIDVLADMMQNSIFKENVLKKEKNIVLEEIKMVNDQPRYYQWILFERQLLQGTLFENPVYGLVKDVSNTTKNSLNKYYKKHYAPNNATLTIVGDLKFNKRKIKKLIKSQFGDWEKSKLTVPVVGNPTNKKRFATGKKDIQQTYLIQGTITPKITSKIAPTIEVIEAILGKPQSGRINNEIRTKKGLAYDVSVSYDNFHNFGFFAINIGTDSKNIDLVKTILKEQYLLKGVSEKELQDAKNYLEGKELLDSESVYHEAETINFWEDAVGRDISKEYLKNIKKVTIEDINTVSKELFKDMTEIQVIPKNI